MRKANIRGFWAVLTACLLILLSGNWLSGAPSLVEYFVVGSSDFSGPYADIMTPWNAGRKSCLSWWNDNVGARIGVKLNFETYDSRYDTAVVSANYPRLVAQFKPLAWLGLGGPDVAALMRRVPEDRIPLVMGTAAYGYAWIPNSWVVQPRPTYPHELAAFLRWYAQRRADKSKPLRVGLINSDLPAYLDVGRGLEKWVKEKGLREGLVWGRTEFVPVLPVDLTASYRRFYDEQIDVSVVFGNVRQVTASIDAMERLGKRIPIVVSAHNGITTVARALGGYKRLDEVYESFGLALPIELNLPAVTQAWRRYGPPSPWTVDALVGCTQVLLTGAGVRRAVEKRGSVGLTGADVYEAFANTVVRSQEMLGLTADLRFTHEQPFPHGARVRIGVVKNARYMSATPEWVPVPELEKW